MNSAKPFLMLAFGSVFLLFGCQTSPTSEPSTAAPEAKAAEPTDPEVMGTPAPGTKFNLVKIGMGTKEVTDLIGRPTDRTSYATGKSRIPFYRGSDRFRHELLYKGMGRLVFTGQATYGDSGHRLIQIQHNANETGYR